MQPVLTLLPLAGTLLAFEAGVRVQRLCRGHALANPVLLAVLAVTAGNWLLGESDAGYKGAVQPLALLLGPATVALAMPLYRCLPVVRRSAMPVVLSVALGSAAAVCVAIAAAAAFGAPALVVWTIATKSVTAAVAMAVAPLIGGDPALAAGLAVMTGILGAAIGTAVLDWAGVTDARARGLAMGVAAHGIGTARMLLISPEAGAFAGLALSLAGLGTGVVLPFVMRWQGDAR